MYRYTPKPERRPAIFLSAVLFIIAFSLFVPFDTAAETLMFLRGIATFAFIGGFIIADRFLLTQFSYSIDETDCGYEFSVKSVRYGRIRTVCRLTDEMITDVYKYERKRARKEKIKTYNYCPEMRCKSVYALRVNDGNDALVLVSLDEAALNIIKNIINRK